MFSVRVKEPSTPAQRLWNRAESVLSPVILFTPIVLKLTGVIAWSWWWVLSPLWISAILLPLVLIVVGVLFVRSAKKQACADLGHFAEQELLRVVAEREGRAGGDEEG